MGLYDVPLSMNLLGFGMETMLVSGIMLVLSAVFNMLVRKNTKTIMQGTVKGGRRRGGQRKRWEDNIGLDLSTCC